MKKLLSLLALLVITTQLFAQAQKAYITKSGKFTVNANKATGYMIVQKLNDNTGYLALQYDMYNNLLSRGTYKDELLTEPSGKFVFYKMAQDDNIMHTASYKPVEAIPYLSETGYFVDGKRTGTWLEYAPTGEKAAQYTYDNSVLNGPFKLFGTSASTYYEGTAVNGKPDGKLSLYYNGLLASESYYENGKLLHKAEYLKPALGTEGLKRFLQRKLRTRYAYDIYGSRFTIKYTVDKTGQIANAQIVSGYSAVINSYILDAVNSYNGFKSATYNNTPIDQQYTMVCNLFTGSNPNGADLSNSNIVHLHIDHSGSMGIAIVTSSR